MSDQALVVSTTSRGVDGLVLHSGLYSTQNSTRDVLPHLLASRTLGAGQARTRVAAEHEVPAVTGEELQRAQARIDCLDLAP